MKKQMIYEIWRNGEFDIPCIFGYPLKKETKDNYLCVDGSVTKRIDKTGENIFTDINIAKEKWAERVNQLKIKLKTRAAEIESAKEPKVIVRRDFYNDSNEDKTL